MGNIQIYLAGELVIQYFLITETFAAKMTFLRVPVLDPLIPVIFYFGLVTKFHVYPHET